MPAWVEGVVDRCLEKRPESRFGSMGEVLAALDEAAGADPLPVAAPWRSPWLRWLVPLLGLIVLVVLAVWAVTPPAPLETVGTDDAKAYAAYEEGREHVRAYLDDAEVEAAVAAFRRAVDRDSTFALAHTGLGEAYAVKARMVGDTALAGQAQRHALEALRLDPGIAGAHVTLGTLELDAGHPREALARFRIALGVDSTSGSVWRAQGDAYRALGEVAAAEGAYRRSIELDPEYWGGYNKLGNLYFNVGDYDRAARRSEAALEADPGNPYVTENFAGTLFQLGRFDEAEEAYRRLVRVRPSAWSHANLGTVYFYEGEYAAAADHYVRALRYSRGDYGILGYLASAYACIPGREGEARETFQRAIAALTATSGWAEDPVRTSELATCHVGVGEVERAVELARAATSPEPHNVDVAINVASVYAEAGDEARAARWLCEASSMGYSQDLILRTPEFEELVTSPSFFDRCVE